MNRADQLVLFYLLVLIGLFAIVIVLVLLQKWRNDWQDLRWRERKIRFHQTVEQCLVDPTIRTPRMRGALRGAFRGWALRQLIAYEKRLTGESKHRLNELLQEWGYYEDIHQWLRDRRWWKRVEALHLITTFALKHERPLVKELLSDRHLIVRRKAFWALGVIGSAEDLPAMLSLLERDGYDWYQLEQVVGTLDKLDFTGEDVQSWVEPLYREISQPFVRRCLVEFQAAKAGYESIPYLMEKLSDREMEVRIGVIKSLTHLHAYSAVPEFVRILSEPTEHVPVKIMAMKGIALLGGHTYLHVMERYLGHPVWWVRYYSAVGIARHVQSAHSELARLSQSHPDAYGREMAHYFLQLLQEEGGLWRSIEHSLTIG